MRVADSCVCCAVVQEAVSTGDPELLQVCLQFRDMQRFTGRVAGIPDLLKKLKEVVK